MVNRAAFLFPGQGAQYPGMGLDLMDSRKARDLFTLASDVMGRDMEALIRDSDGETLKRSDVSQPAITLVNLAAAAWLEERGVLPRLCAGFSLGEYAALVCAGVITAEDCFRLVKARGRAMQDAVDALCPDAGEGRGAPCMLAVIGLPPDEVEARIAEWNIAGLYAANFNSPKQTVVSGLAAALELAAGKFKEAGARRVLPLAVAGPFHSPLMKEAARAFAPVLEAAVFKDPVIPCYSNVSGGLVESGAEAKALAARQITEPVRWTVEEAAIADRGDIEAVLETGPGKVLQGLWRDVGSGIPCYAAGSREELEALRGAGRS
ncbi:MAG: ACP S-malonyltransferase [Spirochaetaceae bacterium]|jgi:[acyl-carrier-protein] S-malonyltransferase|nr:ACP S-malonyltransferase [Spirochaetaceae bacterium]